MMTLWLLWWHNFLEARSENRCEKLHYLVWNRVRIWRIGRHTPSVNSQEYTPGSLRNLTKKKLLHRQLILFKRVNPYRMVPYRSYDTNNSFVSSYPIIPLEICLDLKRILNFIIGRGWSRSWLVFSVTQINEINVTTPELEKNRVSIFETFPKPGCIKFLRLTALITGTS